MIGELINGMIGLSVAVVTVLGLIAAAHFCLREIRKYDKNPELKIVSVDDYANDDLIIRFTKDGKEHTAIGSCTIWNLYPSGISIQNSDAHDFLYQAWVRDKWRKNDESQRTKS